MSTKILNAKVYISQDDTLNTTSNEERVLVVDSDTIRLTKRKTPETPISHNNISVIDRGQLKIIRHTVPSQSITTGYPGEICYDNSFMYICISKNTWRRIKLSEF